MNVPRYVQMPGGAMRGNSARSLRRYVMTQERKETGNGEGLVAIPHDFEVYGMPVKGVRQERDCSIDGNHEEDADNAAI
ncbi:MAG: hypothetical protein Q9168_005542 [Polycauliona sp. 1 TL-2023]